MMGQYGYIKDAERDAKEMVSHFAEEIAEQLQEDGEASTDYNNDYRGGASYHHEVHVDKDYDLLEAAQLLEDLDEYEETDYGLWEGLTPRRAIAAQAAYTYGNAVGSKWQDIIENINKGFEEWKVDENTEGYEEETIENQIKWIKEYIQEKIESW